MHAFLRTHRTVTFERPRGLVSPGAAWRRQAERKAERARRVRATNEVLARISGLFDEDVPDAPGLTAKGRALRRARLNPQPQDRAYACPPDRPALPESS